MSQPLRLVETSPNPPARADVVVIGGGIIGVFTAYYLARRGVVGRPGRKGPHRRRAIEPQLGLVPPAEPRRARTAHGHPEPRAVGSVCRRQRRRHGLQALRPAVPQQRRSPDCRLGQVARVRDDGRRDHAHAQRPRGLGARPGDRPRVERRRLLPQRRHGRSGQGGARRGSRGHETRRHRRTRTAPRAASRWRAAGSAAW